MIFYIFWSYDGKFHMFSHTPGSNPGGGQKQFPIRTKNITAVVHKLADYIRLPFITVEFEKSI